MKREMLLYFTALSFLPALLVLSCTLQVSTVKRTTLRFCEEQDSNYHGVHNFTPVWETESDP